MKKKFSIVLLVVLAMLIMAVVPVLARGDVPVDPAPSTAQIYVIGLLASALVSVLKFVSARWPKVVIKREWLTVALYVISLGLSVAWSGLTLPVFAAFSDPISFAAACLGWANALLLALAPSVAFATLIYNILLKRIFDQWTAKYSG